MRKFLPLATMAAGLVLLTGTLSACSDDSTATAPITGDQVTTTSLYSSSGASDASSAAPESSAEKSESEDRSAEDSDDAPGSNLPETAPNSSTEVPKDFPGPNGQELTDKQKNYLSSLKKQDVTFMGDTDNLVAITMAEYICSEQKKGTDPYTVKAYVTASVGPGTKSVEEANSKADKVIKAAKGHYC